MMPIAKLKLEDGSIARFRVPEGTTPEQVKQFYLANVRDASPQTPVAEPVKPKPKPPVDFDFMTMVGNIPSSGAQWGKDMLSGLTQAATSPVDTAAALGKMAVGGVQRAIPGKQEWEEQYFDPVAQLYSDRYGSWDQFKQTAMDDPVGTLSDVALAPTVAGVGTKALGVTAKGAGALTNTQALRNIGEAASKTGSALTSVGASLDPLNLAYNATLRPIGRSIAKVAVDPSTPAAVYGRGAKWPLRGDMTPESRLNLGETALAEGIRPTAKGIKKLDKLIGDVTGDLNSKLDDATKAGSMINRDALFKYFDDALAKYGSPTRLSGKKNRRIIESMRDKYLQNFDEMTGGETLLTPKQVQDFKIDIYQDLRDMNAFNSPKTTAKGKKAAMKSAARAAKEELEVLAPGIDDINKRLGALRELREAIPRPTNRLSNLNAISLGAPLRTGAGAAMGGAIAGPVGAKIGMGLGGLAAAVDMPSVKFATAEKLYAALNNPVIDFSTKSKVLPALRQILSELEQQAQANPELFAE